MFSEAKEAKRVLERLEVMAQTLAGASLAVLSRENGEIARHSLSRQPERRSSFCVTLREGKQGCRHCLACRRIVLYSAHFRGLKEYTCHGGIHMLVAPVTRSGKSSATPYAIISSPFANPDRERGWHAVKTHTLNAKVDLEKLRSAYYALPALTEERKAIMLCVVDVAAATFAEALPRLRTWRQENASPPESAETLSRSDRLRQVLMSLRHFSTDSPGNKTGRHLADMVIAMVRAEPALPYTVAGIANTARMSPNHFSALFRKHTGITFSAFLAECRIECAKTHLRDATLRVHEAAERAGFNDMAYFSRFFRKLTGKSPSEWRKCTE